MLTNVDKKNGKKRENFICIKCNFSTTQKSDYERHLLTAKHKMLTNVDKKTEKTGQQFICECGKVYKQRQGLSRHKKICDFYNKNIENENETITPANYDDDEKTFLKNQLAEQNKQIQHLLSIAGNNNNSNNTTNNTFNVNFFLNNDCKDAMNITDFIESLHVQLKELEYTTDNGHVKGITNIFHTALANMEENKRPMHCTDLKREVLYIKDNDEWHKDENKELMKCAVTKVVDKNIENQAEWMERHPEILTPGSKDSNRYVKMMSESLGTGSEMEQHKIMKNIMKDVKLETK